MSMKKSILSTMLPFLAMGSMFEGESIRYRNYSGDALRKRPARPDPRTFSAGHYNGQQYNKISKRRIKNKTAKRSRKINR